VGKNLKELFRSGTQVFISKSLDQAITEALATFTPRKVLVFVDKNLAGVEPLKKAMAQLKKSRFDILTRELDVREPDVDLIDEEVNKLSDFKPDVAIGIGGGSLIDIAKAVSVLLYNEGSSAQYQGPNLLKRPGAKKIMIPTTAGTGSEVTPGAVIVNRVTGRKGAIGSPFIMPDIAILEPLLTLGMPPRVMASTAMDAITHCVESYVGKATNPFASMYAREGFRYLINAFGRILRDPLDIEARLHMLVGSTMGGFAIFNTDTGACHSMAYPLGTYHNVPHGIANALLIPLVIEHNIYGGCTKYAELYDVVESRDTRLTDPLNKSRALLDLIRLLMSKTDLPSDFRDYGVMDDNIQGLAEKGLALRTALGNNPVEFKYVDALNALERLSAKPVNKGEPNADN